MNEPEHFGFFVADGISLLFFLSMYDTLRVANEISGQKLYRYTVISETGKPVKTCNGMSVLAEAAIADIDSLPNLVVCTGYEPERHLSKGVLSWLRRLVRHGTRIGAMDTGCHLLASAGLVSGYRVTMHWQVIESFRERFPDVEVTHRFFEIDRDRFTCGGGKGGFEMMLHLIGLKHGQGVTAAIAEQFLQDVGDFHPTTQRYPLTLSRNVHSSAVLAAVDIMQSHIEDPVSIETIAQRLGVSTRQLERDFRSHLDETPKTHYLNLRLDKARTMLQQTAMTISDICVATGFSSVSHFSRSYSKRFACSPRSNRALSVFSETSRA